MASQQNPKVRVLHRSHGKLKPEIQPIVLEYKRKKKARTSEQESKEEYSDGLEDIQRLEGDVVRISQRGARALSKGLDTYEHERHKSALEKKDGAIEDFVYNSAKATSAYLKEASELPVDIAESLNRISYRRLLRENLRMTSRMMRLWRL